MINNETIAGIKEDLAGLREAVFEYAFKRALREVEELLDLAKWDTEVNRWQAIGDARRELLKVRPGCAFKRSILDDFAALKRPAKVLTEPPTAGRGQNGPQPEKVSETLEPRQSFYHPDNSPLKDVFANYRPRPTYLFTVDSNPEKGQSQDASRHPTPVKTGLDFTGRWLTADGTRAQISGPQRPDGNWDGLLTGGSFGMAGGKLCTWDKHGNTGDPRYNLVDRLREGAFHAD